MKTYRLAQGKLRPHPDGEWVRREDAQGLLEACKAIVYAHEYDDDILPSMIEMCRAAIAKAEEADA